MEFNENLAKEIVEKHGLSEKTILVWKTRGKIPNRYLDENYKIGEKADDKYIEHLRLINILNMQNIFKETKFEQITISYDNYSTDDCLLQHYIYEALMSNGTIRLRLDYLDDTLKSASLEVSSFRHIGSNNEPASQDQFQEALDIYFRFITNKAKQV